ncbi:MAG: 2-amino-4-hydroxy-6-hydroxymethyldihydropteridine diphosphokinase [Gammaproteobacteria bacterium]|nr:MAG: 2-amino-4-hydroxy-6-hydroxymethyldihydropteridine diphosphokinase [Gammaproteobacteria bacterium]
MKTVQVFIGLGSNLEKPIEQVHSALNAVKTLACDGRLSVSPLYRSKPMGPVDQPDYINAVAGFETVLEAEALLEQLQLIERLHGRVRDGERWGPRTLDLDILLYGQEMIDEPALTIPHPGMHQRAFVMLPLYDIAPELHIPGMGRLADLVKSVDRGDIEKLPE